MCGENCYPVTISSGDTINIYIKAKFHQSVDFPLFGFAIKTINGVIVYGDNTRISNIAIPPAKRNDIIIFRFSGKMSLYLGNYFITLE
jgi:lipopolysaccharide transport system ATP-binding protein